MSGDKKPELVREAERLMALYQAAEHSDECVEAVLSCYWGISEIMVAAEIRKDGRLIALAAPQVAQLATRLAWLASENPAICKDLSPEMSE
jgi:hypothetical protein